MTLLLKELSYFRTGGSYRRLLTPKSPLELKEILRCDIQPQEPMMILGAGSNSLVMDTPWPGAVISMHLMDKIKPLPDYRLYVEAGRLNSELAEYCFHNGLGGTAWMYRLPGQLGATTRMNARCYGGEISHIVRSIETVDRQGKVATITNPQGSSQVFRGYKDTIFMNGEQVIAAVTVQLHPESPDTIQEKMEACEKDRLAKNHFQFPSCGCVFKNQYSIGVPSGMLLEHANVSQLNTVNIFVNPRHANFVFHKDASAEAILRFTLEMRERVYQKFGVWLEYEMEILGVVPEELQHKLRKHLPSRPNELVLEPLRKLFQKKMATKT